MALKGKDQDWRSAFFELVVMQREKELLNPTSLILVNRLKGKIYVKVYYFVNWLMLFDKIIFLIWFITNYHNYVYYNLI